MRQSWRMNNLIKHLHSRYYYSTMISICIVLTIKSFVVSCIRQFNASYANQRYISRELKMHTQNAIRLVGKTFQLNKTC